MKQLNLGKKHKAKPGRKLGRPKSTHCGARRKREEFSSSHPLHVTLRLRDDLPNLRTPKGAQLIKHAIIGAQEHGVRVIHFAILSNHIHCIIEADSRASFFNAMKSFLSRVGKQIRKAAEADVIKRLGRLGIFRGRYDFQILKTPTQLKNALKYVLFNPCKHFKKNRYLDVFTSACVFEDLKKLTGEEFKLTIALNHLKDRIKSFIATPKTWLMREGWKRAPA